MNDFIYMREEEEPKEKVKTLGVEKVIKNLGNNKKKNVKEFVKSKGKCYLCQLSNPRGRY